MPRGDNKKSGERRVRRQPPSTTTTRPKFLEARVKDFEDIPEQHKQGFKKPGSQKR